MGEHVVYVYWTDMSLLKYITVSRSSESDRSTSASCSDNYAEGSCETDQDQDASDNVMNEADSEPSPSKRARTVSLSLDTKLSESEIDAILTAEVPDLGLFPVVKIRNSAATNDRLKEKLLKSRFLPSKTWVAPKRQCGQKKRCVSASTKNFIHVFVSATRDALYCIACILFGSQNVMLTTEPLTDWSNAKRLVSKHEKTSDHRFAQQRSIDFLGVCDKEQLGIAQHMTKAQYEIIQHNTKVLHAIISLIVTCGRQNVPIRGKTDDRSNFMSFLKYRAAADPDLQQHLKSCPKNAKYTSHRIQNELINLCGNQIKNKIIASIKTAGVFTVLADETADISCTEQVAICIRYVVKEDKKYTAQEDFVAFIPTRDTTGETLSNIILTQISQWGLDPANIVGQGYDGAGNMSGRTKGAQARISSQYPGAKYVHCKNHSLNLAIVHTCKQRIVSNMFTALGEVLYFLTSSPKRLQVYLDSTGSNGPRLQRMCETRWSQHAECVTQCIDNFTPILVALSQLSNDYDQKTSSSAFSFLKTISSFDFIITICACQNILPHLTPLSDHLQDPHCDLVIASSRAQTLCNLMEKKRKDTTWSTIWQSAIHLAGEHDILVCKPRTAGRQIHRSNTPSQSVEDYWRLNLFYPFIDQLITELQDRLCKPLPRLKAQYLVPSCIANLSSELWQDIKAEYNSLLSQPSIADVELEGWKHAIASGAVNAQTLQEAVFAAHFMFPNIHTILKVLLTMPDSTATAERSFSGLRRLKTYLRSNMTETRLSALALLHIHHDTNIDIPEIVREFDTSGTRRIAFLHTADTTLSLT